MKLLVTNMPVAASLYQGVTTPSAPDVRTDVFTCNSTSVDDPIAEKFFPVKAGPENTPYAEMGLSFGRVAMAGRFKALSMVFLAGSEKAEQDSSASRPPQNGEGRIEGLLDKAYELRKNRKPEEALPIYSKIIEEIEDMGDRCSKRMTVLLSKAFEGLGNSLFKLKRYDDAIAAFERSHGISGNSFALHGIIKVYSALNDPQKTLEMAKKAVQFNDKDFLNQLELCRAWRKLRKYENALDAAEQAVKLRGKTDQAVHFERGVTLRYLRRLKESERALKTAIRLCKYERYLPKYYHALGLTISQRGRLEEAKAAFEESLRLQPENIFALFDLATTLRGLGHYQEAYRLITKIVQEDKERTVPTRSGTYRELGILERFLGNLDASEDTLRMAIRCGTMNSSIAKAYVELGITLSMKGRNSDALDALGKAIELGGERSYVLSELGIVLRKLGRPDESFEMLLKSYELNIKEGKFCPQLFMDISISLCHSKRYDKAIEFLDECIEEAQRRYVAVHHVILEKIFVLVLSSRFQEAKVMMEKIIEERRFSESEIKTITSILAGMDEIINKNDLSKVEIISDWLKDSIKNMISHPEIETETEAPEIEEELPE